MLEKGGISWQTVLEANTLQMLSDSFYQAQWQI